MSTSPAKAKASVIDEAERERIRGALRRYKEAHGIGDPTLQEHIVRTLRQAESLKNVDHDFVPLKTLQRFLKGTHRTDDKMLRRYRKFLETAGPPPPYEIMGDAITTFYSRPHPDHPVRGLEETAARYYARKYRCYLRGERTYLPDTEAIPYKDFPIPEDDPFEPVFHIPYSIITMEPLAGTPYLKVSEKVYNFERKSLVTEIDTVLAGMGGRLYEGVMARSFVPEVSVITMRALMFSYPKFYMLQCPAERPKTAAKATLIGSCMSVNPEGWVYCESFQVKLYPFEE